jgi:hypothetical protein
VLVFLFFEGCWLLTSLFFCCCHLYWFNVTTEATRSSQLWILLYVGASPRHMSRLGCPLCSRQYTIGFVLIFERHGRPHVSVKPRRNGIFVTRIISYRNEFFELVLFRILYVQNFNVILSKYFVIIRKFWNLSLRLNTPLWSTHLVLKKK